MEELEKKRLAHEAELAQLAEEVTNIILLMSTLYPSSHLDLQSCLHPYSAKHTMKQESVKSEA